MRVKQAVTRPVDFVDAEASIAEVTRRMNDTDLGFLPVVAENVVVGVVTDRDIAIRAIPSEPDVGSTPVSTIMTRNVVCCFEDDELESAAGLMSENGIRRILVLDEQRRPMGILSIEDIAAAGEPQIAGNVLRDIVASQGGPKLRRETHE